MLKVIIIIITKKKSLIHKQEIQDNKRERNFCFYFVKRNISIQYPCPWATQSWPISLSSSKIYSILERREKKTRSKYVTKKKMANDKNRKKTLKMKIAADDAVVVR